MVGILLSGYSAIVFAQNRDELAVQHYQAGQRAQQAGDYSKAVEEYQKVLAIMPRTAEVYASLGLVYNAENKFSESAQTLRMAYNLKPGLAGVSLYLGIDLVKLNQAPVAIRYLKEALRIEPENKQAWLWLSAAYSESGQSMEAIGQLRKANLRFASDPDILFRLGEAYREIADSRIRRILETASGQPIVHQIYGDIYKDEAIWPKANGHYQRAIAENTRWPDAHFGLGKVALAQGKLGVAEKEFREELAINPRSASAGAKLAEIALLRGQLETALELLDQAIHNFPSEAASILGFPFVSTNAESKTDEQTAERLQKSLSALQRAPKSQTRMLALAIVYWKLGEGEPARSSWKEFEDTLPTSTAGDFYRQALDNFYRGNFDSAESKLREWLEVEPKDLKAEYLLAKIYRGFSLSLLGQLLSVAPDSYPAHRLLGETYENSEAYDQAIAEYKLVEKRASDLPGIHFAIGHLLLKIGDLDQAKNEFQAELNLNPNHVGANAELGTIFVKKGEGDQGIGYLRKAISLEPDQWEAHRELGEVYYMQKKFSMAEEELEKAVDHDPEGSVHYQLGLVYRALGRSDAAKKMFARSRVIKEDQLSEANVGKALPEVSQP